MQDSSKISRRDFLSYAGAAAGMLGLGLGGFSCSSSNPAGGSGGKRPNIVLIVADDLGYNDLGCQGGTEIPTPFIDSIAAQGIRFTDAYVTAPVCGPSRAALLTGIYQQRFGFEFNIYDDFNNNGIPTNVKNLAEHLKPQGYRTCAIGKWHVGSAENCLPNNRGFDEFFGIRGGARNYFELELKSGEPLSYYQNVYINNDVVSEKEYFTDALGREAVSFINKQDKAPFFMYLAFTAVHLPLQAKKEYEAKFKGKIKGSDRVTYAGMLVSMDEAVGKVLAAIKEKGIEDDTLIIFLSDNGGKLRIADNAPLRGQKAQMLEGGIRVPMLLQWKDKIQAGSQYSKPVISIDLAATALAAGGVKADIEGVDLIPYIRGEETGSPHDALFWKMGDVWAVRQGDWKMIGRPLSQSYNLYNIAEYIREKDISAEHPEKVKQMIELYNSWNKGNIEPAWQRSTVQLVP